MAAADAAMHAVGLKFDPPDLAFLLPYRQRTQAALPPGEHSTLTEDGGQLPLLQALAEARAHLAGLTLIGRS
jgi:hypothetical protein